MVAPIITIARQLSFFYYLSDILHTQDLSDDDRALPPQLFSKYKRRNRTQGATYIVDGSY
jgi:hypothetical protein